jgi:hypothetical protein
MKTLHSELHKELVGSVNDVPFTVAFDAEGLAFDVDDSVAELLTNGRYGVIEVDEDGALVDKEALEKATLEKEALQKAALEKEALDKQALEQAKGNTDEKDASKKTSSKKDDKGSVTE